MKKLNIFLFGCVVSGLAVANPVYLSPIDESSEQARLRFIMKFADKEAEQLSKSVFDRQIQQQITTTFGRKQQLNEKEFLESHNAQILKEVEKFYSAQVKQTKVRFDAIDQDKNGEINLHEFQTVGLSSFQRYDSNKDGWLSIEDDQHKVEENAQQKDNEQVRPKVKPLLSMPTTHNATGFLTLYNPSAKAKISLADYLKTREEQYQRTDLDQNGVLSHTEYETEFFKRVDDMVNKSLDVQQAFLQKRFKAIDSNGDGKVSRQDVKKFSQALFAYWDTNQDGKVDLQEQLP